MCIIFLGLLPWQCCRALGISFTSAIRLLAAMSEAGIVEPTLALELLAKRQRFGRYDARIVEDVGPPDPRRSVEQEGGKRAM